MRFFFLYKDVMRGSVATERDFSEPKSVLQSLFSICYTICFALFQISREDDPPLKKLRGGGTCPPPPVPPGIAAPECVHLLLIVIAVLCVYTVIGKRITGKYCLSIHLKTSRATV